MNNARAACVAYFHGLVRKAGAYWRPRVCTLGRSAF